MIGVMQGRLTPSINGQIQAFPERFWEAEFFLARSLGVDLIEWTLDFKGIIKNPLIAKCERVKLIQKISGVRSISVTYDAAMQAPLIENREIKKYELDIFRKVILACKRAGLQYIVFPLVDGSSVTSDNYGTYVDFFRFVSKELLNAELSIAIESDFDPTMLKEFIEDIGRPDIGVNYDTGNSASLGYSFYDEMKAYGKHILNIHIKDRVYKGETVEFGQGDAPLSRQINYFQSELSEVNLIIQGARSKTGNDIGIIEQYLRFLRENLQ